MQVPTGQAQVEAAIEKHQADQQAHQGLQTPAQGFGFDQVESGPADHQANREQQHHRRQARESGN